VGVGAGVEVLAAAAAAAAVASRAAAVASRAAAVGARSAADINDKRTAVVVRKHASNQPTNGKNAILPAKTW
jgi:hypothetical protein